MEALSDISSLAGVPGWLSDVTLACLDRSFPTFGSGGTDEAGEAENRGAISVFGVGNTRMVLGAVLLTGDPVDATAGLFGCDPVDARESARGFLAWMSVFPAVEAVSGWAISLEDNFVAAAISSFAGGWRFDDVEAARLLLFVSFCGLADAGTVDVFVSETVFLPFTCFEGDLDGAVSLEVVLSPVDFASFRLSGVFSANLEVAETGPFDLVGVAFTSPGG
jgi:hypothetical protein